MALKGNLDTMTLAEVLQWCGMGQKTGVLDVRRHQISKQVHFKTGHIIFTVSSDPREYLGQFLVGRGLISEEDLNLALKTQAETKILLGRIFMIVGLIEEQQMAEVLLEKAHESICDMFLWDSGEFEFKDNLPPPPDIVPIDLQIETLVFEGAVRLDRWKRIREVFPNDAVYFGLIEDKIPPSVWSDLLGALANFLPSVPSRGGYVHRAAHQHW